MRLKCVAHTFIVLLLGCWAGSADVLGQSDCAQRIEEQYLLEDHTSVMELSKNCNWQDSSRILPMLAFSAFQTNNYPLAKQLYHHLLESGDTTEVALRSLARIYEEEWNFPRAIKYNKLLLNQDTSNAAEWYRLGIIAQKAELVPEAILAFTRTIALNPKHFQARVKIADILIHQKQADQAGDLISKGLQLDSQNVLLLLYAGKAAYFQDSFQYAVEYYDRAERSVDLPLTHTRMKAISYYQLDDFKKAISYLSDALVGTDKDYMHYYMAMSYLGLDDKEEAKKHFDLALEESYGPRIPLYCDYRADLYEQEGNWKEAISLYKEAYDRSGDPKFLIRLALAYDKWYDDKRLAIRYLNDYLVTDDNKYRSFAQDRIQVLRAYEHMKNIPDETKAD